MDFTSELILQIESILKEGKSVKPRDLTKIKAITDNPISQLLISLYTKDGELNFAGMVSELQNFVSKSPLDSKLFLIFRIYDTDKDGKISKKDLTTMLKILSNDNIEENKINDIVEKTFKFEVNDSEFIEFQEFCKIIKSRNNNLHLFFRCN
ncbi:putative calcineurin [Hamiltosporidium magnivora]|uniref:Calcineurin subunit B n=1 Tax=Hamiltosporidium magnivora TaxID=148818 RepID=A0A4V2JVL2_9MICR|nr:putative EF-hand domain-containing calcineurin [Hamiltosporidium magnivora]TBU05194.1 putative calcineurin [Hamiltosporidium magnivora]